jgi:Flp pilus assembly protein TadD
VSLHPSGNSFREKRHPGKHLITGSRVAVQILSGATESLFALQKCPKVQIRTTVVRLPWKTVLGAIVFGLSLLFFFWSDACLWLADVNLSRRNHAAAQIWVARSGWFGNEIDGRTCLLKLRIAGRQGNFREVEHLLKQSEKFGVPYAEIQRHRWLAMAQTNQFDLMQSHWNELLQNPRDDEPEIARAYYTWAMLHHNYSLAMRTLELWHQDCPRDSEPLKLKGLYYQSKTDWEGAEKAYQNAFAVAPGNDEIRLLLANALQVRLKTNEAIPHFQQYLRRHPDDLTAVRGLAESMATRGDVKAAILLLRAALEKSPDDFMLQKTCGELLLSLGDAPAAAALLEKAYRTAPEHANLANSLARAWKACGRVDEAQPLFAFVAASQPKLAEMEILEKQLQGDQNNLELRMKIAAIVARYVSRRDAIRWYENLLIIAPNYRLAHQQLVELYRSFGEEEKAVHHTIYLEQISK